MKSEKPKGKNTGENSPAPHGAGGLKFQFVVNVLGGVLVPPRTGRVD